MIKIRNAALEDVPQLLNIYNEAVRSSTATFDLEEQTLDERLAWFETFGDKYPLIVAETDQEVIGYCCLSPFNKKPAYQHTVELSIYLSSPHRGTGIGSMLMQEIIKRARRLQFHSIISLITSGNEASIKLHQKFGFQFAGKLREVGYKFGEWLDVDYYQLLIKESE